MTASDVSVIIEPMIRDHWPDVRRIYADGMATRNATFDTTAPGWEPCNWTHLFGCRLAVRMDD